MVIGRVLEQKCLCGPAKAQTGGLLCVMTWGKKTGHKYWISEIAEEVM